MNYVWTLLVAVMGSAIAAKLKIPAGPLVGSLLAVGCLNAFKLVEVPAPPQGTKFVLQVGLGILLGATITSEAVAGLRQLWQPAVICTGIALVASMTSGWAVSRWMGIEKLTAMLGAAPGGISDMSLIALDMGAQGSTVVLMHLTRMISVIVVVPLVVRMATRGG